MKRKRETRHFKRKEIPEQLVVGLLMKNGETIIGSVSNDLLKIQEQLRLGSISFSPWSMSNKGKRIEISTQNLESLEIIDIIEDGCKKS